VSQSVDSVFRKFQILFFIVLHFHENHTPLLRLHASILAMQEVCVGFFLLFPSNLALYFLSLLVWIFVLLCFAYMNPICLVSLGTLSRIWFFF
jgi:hypothetical protein